MKITDKNLNIALTISIIVACIIGVILNETQFYAYSFIIGGIFAGISIVEKRVSCLIISCIHILIPAILPIILWFLWPLILRFP